MATSLKIKVIPSAALSDAEKDGLAILYARLLYTSEVNVQSEGSDGINEVFELPSSLRETLDNAGECVLQVEDYKDGTNFVVRIETTQGTIVWTSPELQGNGNDIEVKVDKKILIDASKRTYPGITAILERVGRFVHISESTEGFEKFTLYVTAIKKGSAREKAAKDLLSVSAGDPLTSLVTKLDQDDKLHNLIIDLSLRPGKIRADGSFEISLGIEGDEEGWFWLLISRQIYAGYVSDAKLVDPSPSVLFTLPPPDDENMSAAGAGAVVAALGESGESNGGAKRLPYFDFDEALINANPELFSEDLGVNCKPFKNPQRILGERRFHTILRVDQPDVGGKPSLSLKFNPKKLISPDSIRVRMDLTPVAGIPISPIIPFEPPQPGVVERIMRVFRPAPAMAVASPPILTMPSLWTLITARRKPVSEDNPIKWEGDPEGYQATTVASGHILEWRVQWRSNGYSLGNVAHSLTLAPRQTKRIATLSWSRREQASRKESTLVSESVDQSTTRDREYSDAVQSVLSEWSRGGSKSKTTGVAGGIGFALGPVVIGGGAAHGRSSSSSWQRGGRSVSASEQQSLRDAIRQHGESLRSNETTVVTEVTQEEEIEGVSEVLRNPNYCHSLTVIYHEILRHLRVDTVISGVRECLFVPFSLTKFNVIRALRWRDLLRRGLRKWTLRWTLSYLDEVSNNFAGSSIPEGKRSEHPIKYVSGSIYIQLAIERPEDALEDAFDETLWIPFGFLLPHPARHIVDTLFALGKEKRDRYFQREIAPTMAARLADMLILKADNLEINGVDFTLGSSYRFNRVIRVDFSYTPESPIMNRSNLENLKVIIDPDISLPKGSVANVKYASIHYYTAQFDRTVRSVSTTDDIVDTTTGLATTEGATLFFPITSWENQDLRARIRTGVGHLINHLNEHIVYYHKVIWWHMDRDELYMMLDGFSVPNGGGRSIASVAERQPMAILGNCLVFRVASGAFLGIDNHESPEMLNRYYIDSESKYKSEPIRISLATEGLYAQAIMDDCEACEEHMGSTDWVLKDKDPELEDLLPAAFSQRRAESQNLTPTPFQAPIINLQNAPQAPDPTGLSGIINAVTKGDSFRDMAGLAGTQASAQAAMTQAASLATTFGTAAVDLQKSREGTANAKQKLDNIKKAQKDGLVDAPEATKQATKVLDAQNMTPQAPKLTQDEPIKSALNNAAVAGQPIEVSRQTKDGFETIKIGESPDDAIRPARNYIIERDDLTPGARAFDPLGHGISGATSFSVRIGKTEDLPSDAFVRWSVPPGERGRYTLAGGSNVQAGKTVQITGLRPGKSEIVVELRRTGGSVLESVRYPLSIPQFVSVDIDPATFTPVMTGFGLAAPDIETMLKEAKRVCLTVLSSANVRTVWLMAGFKETLPAQFAAGGAAAANLTTATLKGDHASKYGTAGIAGVPGPTSYADKVEVYPGGFDIPVSSPNENEHVDGLTNSLVKIIKAFPLMSSPEKNLAITVFGRLIGETLSHEILHTLIGKNIARRFHYAKPGIESDIMNLGFNRSFTARTGFDIDKTKIAGGDLTTIITNDKGRVFINIPTGVAQAQLNKWFPVPGLPGSTFQ